MNIKKTIGALMMCAISAIPMMAQQTCAESYQPCTYQEMEQLTVNEQVTTVITASEPIRFVDISTDKIAGDQPINNTVRLKPKEGMHEDGEVLAIVTIVTERYRTQYALLYTTISPISTSSSKRKRTRLPSTSFTFSSMIAK